jgi:2-polyprenyl-3-methyl-5-hydroxy-6-metoxy-1,4-benzoquinol methylase
VLGVRVYPNREHSYRHLEVLPSQYYSLASEGRARKGLLMSVVDALRIRAIMQPSYARSGPWYSLLRRLELTEPSTGAIGRLRPPNTARILDVGCGSGWILQQLDALGYENLTGIDPFLSADHRLGRVELRKAQMASLAPNDKFDLIMLYHSLDVSLALYKPPSTPGN